MANQESTAIHDLIRLVQGGQVERVSDPVPEPFVPAVRLQETLDVDSGDIPSLGRHRAASGTPAPYLAPPAVVPGYLQPQHGPVYTLPTPIAQGTPAQAYRIPTHTVEQDEEQTELWQGTPRPARTSMPAPRALSSRVMPLPTNAEPYIPTRPDLSKLAGDRSLVRYAGLGLLAVAAISIGTYLGATSGGGSDDRPSERDRAIAIMSGELPAPPPSTHVTAPSMPTVRIEAVPAPVVEPIEPEVIWSAPVVVDSTEIEMDAVRKPAARRTARVARLQTRPVEKPSKADKKEKLAKKAIVATEIVAPKGAAVVSGTGQVTITSNKAAMIFLDGRPTGRAAPSSFVIPAGDHQITLLDPVTKKAKTATIKVAANKAHSISREF